jgi:hypothetical protein
MFAVIFLLVLTEWRFGGAVSGGIRGFFVFGRSFGGY